MLQFLVKGKMKKKTKSSSKGPRISRKDKIKKKEDEHYPPPRSTGGEVHEDHDNRSEFSNFQSENLDLKATYILLL